MAMDTTEEADLLEFDLDGKSIRAWVWVSVFSEGDEVEVVAERVGDVWQGYGIRRTSDHVVALHPHCSRGRYAHYKASAKWWIGITLSLGVIGSLMISIIQLVNGEYDHILSAFLFFLIFGTGTLMLVTGFIAFRVSRKFMGFVKLAENIFDGFGWCNVKDIDLPAITKNGKGPGDPEALGILYFRY